MSRSSVCISIVLAAQLVPVADASAAEPPEVRVLAAGGYGTQDDEDAGSFGAAFGLKGGLSLFRWVHLGVQGTYHVGTRFGEENNQVNYLGLETGVRFADELIGVTPYLTGGVSTVASQRNADDSFVAPYLGLALSVDVAPLQWLVLGVDVRLITIPQGVRQGDNSGDASTLDLLMLAGTRFELEPAAQR